MMEVIGTVLNTSMAIIYVRIYYTNCIRLLFGCISPSLWGSKSNVIRPTTPTSGAQPHLSELKDSILQRNVKLSLTFIWWVELLREPPTAAYAYIYIYDANFSSAYFIYFMFRELRQVCNFL